MIKLKKTVLYMLIGLFVSCLLWVALYIIFNSFIKLFGAMYDVVIWLILIFMACLAIFILRQLNKILHNWYEKSLGFYLKCTLSIVLSHVLIFIICLSYTNYAIGVGVAGMYVTISILIAMAIGIVIGIFSKII